MYVTALAVLVVISLMMFVFMSGCESEAVGSPEEIIKKAIKAQGDLKSVNLEIDTGIEMKSPGDTRTVTISYKGLFEKPDKWQLLIQSSGMKSEVIIIGEDAFVKAAGSDTWRKQKSDVLGTDTSTENMVSLKYLDSASDVRLVDKKEGRYHLQFNLDVAANAALFDVTGVTEFDRSLVTGKKAQMEIWVLKDKYYIEKGKLSFSRSPSGEKSGGINVLIETLFSEFNEPVSIEPPI